VTLSAIRESPDVERPAAGASAAARPPPAPQVSHGKRALAGQPHAADPAARRTDAVGTHACAPVLDAAAILRLNATVHASQSFAQAATAFASELAVLLGASRVCLGFVDNGYVEVVAVSGNADFEARADLFRCVAAAMDEAVEQGATLVHPPPAQQRPRVTLAQAELGRRASSAVASIPLVCAGQAIGAVSIESRRGGGFGTHELEWCEHLACALAPTLVLKRNAGLSWHRRLRQALRSAGAGLRQPGRIGVKLLVPATLAGIAALCLWPVEYRVGAPARLEGAIQRALVAPADGYLQQAHVKPGDAVKAGQVLAELADQDLELERRKWASEMAQNENSSRAALARGERTQYVIAQGKAAEARAQLELVDQQLLRGRIRAPFDGIVIKGDLSQMLGAPVQRGDVLLTIAPAQQFRLIVEVDERDIGDVKAGADGVVALVALAALPGETGAFQVVRVTPVATSRDGRNFYDVEGRLGGAVSGLRPGLQGVGKIKATDRPLAWIWGHRLLDWARLTLWSLGG
jgi:multidrug efflux pump subunit AcrA (membrane-fusion protein)